MKTNKIIVIMSISFILIMGFLTLTAKDIHRQMIPNVTVTRLSREYFQYEMVDEDGKRRWIESKIVTAIPKELYDQGDVFVIFTAEKNGDIRTFARKIDIEIGMQNEEYYEVTNLMYDNSLRLIIDSNQEIRDGDEVYIRQDIFQVKSGLIDRE